MSLTTVKKELQQLEKNNLIDLCLTLYKKNKLVKAYLDYYADPDAEALYKTYKTKVEEAFTILRKRKPKLKNAKQALKDFKVFDPAPDMMANLLLFYVEMGVKYTKRYGDMSMAYYEGLTKIYREALVIIEKEQLHRSFKTLAFDLYQKTEGIGWTFHNDIGLAYKDVFGVD